MSADPTLARLAHSPSARDVLGATAPVVLFLAAVGAAALVYALRNRTHPPFHDEEMDQRDAGGLTTPTVRHFFAWLMRPLWQTLARARFPPDVITKLSVAIAFGAAVAVAGGRFALGGWLFLGSGLLDFLDGRIARATDTATPGGAVLDSVLDRYVEASFLIGLCWYYRNDWALFAGLLALAGSLLVPYVRARAEALHVKVDDVGFMQRTERVAALGLGTALSPALDAFVTPQASPPRHYLTLGALVVLAVTSHVSALQRLRRVLGAFGDARPREDRLRPLKSIAANGVATGVDFAFANALFFAAGLHGAVATVAGCVGGALVSFTLSRTWAFRATGGRLSIQLDRYVVASAVTALLNGGGVALLLFVNAPFAPSWLLSRAVVFACWSYPVQRDFVFGSVTGSGARQRRYSAAAFTAGRTPRAHASAPR